jgi:hypothetical protein
MFVFYYSILLILFLSSNSVETAILPLFIEFNLSISLSFFNYKIRIIKKIIKIKKKQKSQKMIFKRKRKKGVEKIWKKNMMMN